MPRARLGSRSLVVVFAVTLPFTGCSCQGERRAQPAPLPTIVPQATLDPILFDARGRLRPSELEVGALVLPMGLAAGASGEREHQFTGIVPIAAVHAYFRTHLVAPGIEQHGDWLSFAYARPVTDQGISDEHYDVIVEPEVGGVVRVRVISRAPEPSTMTEAQRLRQMREAMERDSL